MVLNPQSEATLDTQPMGIIPRAINWLDSNAKTHNSIKSTRRHSFIPPKRFQQLGRNLAHQTLLPLHACNIAHVDAGRMLPGVRQVDLHVELGRGSIGPTGRPDGSPGGVDRHKPLALFTGQGRYTAASAAEGALCPCSPV